MGRQSKVERRPTEPDWELVVEEVDANDVEPLPEAMRLLARWLVRGHIEGRSENPQNSLAFPSTPRNHQR